uniref:Uncharacterized protein n=1 Tax=Aegilops tauschii TaxID=37682 RepID=M8CTE4_AEGTA
MASSSWQKLGDDWQGGLAGWANWASSRSSHPWCQEKSAPTTSSPARRSHPLEPRPSPPQFVAPLPDPTGLRRPCPFPAGSHLQGPVPAVGDRVPLIPDLPCFYEHSRMRTSPCLLDTNWPDPAISDASSPDPTREVRRPLPSSQRTSRAPLRRPRHQVLCVVMPVDQIRCFVLFEGDDRAIPRSAPGPLPPQCPKAQAAPLARPACLSTDLGLSPCSSNVAIVRIHWTTSGRLLRGFGLLPSGISGKMFITLDLTTIFAMLVVSMLLLCRATYHLFIKPPKLP